MKDLRLWIYPPTHGKHADWQNTPCLACREDCVGGSKRLTDAELAAEVHAAVLQVYRRKVHGDGTPESLALTHRAIDEMTILNRFATHPHYDEADS